MRRTLRVALQGLCGTLLCAWVLASPVEPARGALSARAVALEKPAYMIVDAVVRGDRLFLPDYTKGLREVDLRTGKDLRSVLPMGTEKGQVTGPQHLGCGPERCLVFGDRYFWVYYDTSWRFLLEYPGMRSSTQRTAPGV